MERLLREIERLKDSKIGGLVQGRMRDFEKLGKSSDEDIFKELCFCILTANYTAEGGIRVQREIGDDFLTLPERELARQLKDLGYRFPNTRSKYIVEARKYKDSLKEIVNSKDEFQAREWLIRNVKGLGYKEASHLLRNIGFKGLAIIDFHIVDLLAKHEIIKKPKDMTNKKYLEIEGLLRDIADKANINLAELDLYLWYMETGKVLK